jgi:hypothetical protein
VTNREKLERPQGLCTNLMRTDKENAAVVCEIVNTYASGVPLQRTVRTMDDWQALVHFPVDFNRRYRVAQ